MSPSPVDRVRGTRPLDLTEKVSTRITLAEARALDALAARNKCSKGALVREIIRDGMAPLLES
jgi:hypothetical protein